MCARSVELRGDAEDGVDELPLRYGIALSNPADLSFSDCMHRLVTLDRSARTLDRSESEARRDPLLDESMVLLDDVVQVRRWFGNDSADQVRRTASGRRSRWRTPDARPH